MRSSAPDKGVPCRPELHGGSGAVPPLGTRLSDLTDRGVPGGTVGTTTGRPQGLSPAQCGVQRSPGDGRKSPRRALGERPKISRSNRTAFAGRPPSPCASRGAEGRRPDWDQRESQGARSLKGHNPVPIARGNGEPCFSCRPHESGDPVIADAGNSISNACVYWVPARGGHHRCLVPYWPRSGAGSP